MSKVKHAVKKGSGQGNFMERLIAEKKEWTARVYRYTQQETLDAACLVLHEVYGFGPERLKRFAEGYERTWHDLQELERQDKHDPDRVWSVEKIESALKEALGPYYSPREERYGLQG